MARVLVPLADGFEEIEAVTTVDILRRAGIEVIVSGLSGTRVTGSHGITIRADRILEDALNEDYDMIVLPGGMPGADNLENDPRIISMLRDMAERGRFTAAICAAPKVLAAAGLLDGKRATSYPGFLDATRTPGLTVTEAPVEQQDKVITSRGPGTAMDFALARIENLLGRADRDSIERALQRPS